jgi:demethylspheroidene O-methyltransferase
VSQVATSGGPLFIGGQTPFGRRTAGRMVMWRDRLLASPRFQRWAAGFPLTRGVARRRARDLFDLVGGFVYSQVLFACVELRLCEILMDAPRTPDDLAIRLSLPRDSMTRLLEAAIALRLVERRGGGMIGVGPLGAALTGNPGIAAMVRHHALLYADLRDPVALLRRGNTRTALNQLWAYTAKDGREQLEPDQIGDYTALMAESQPLVARDVLECHDLRRHRCLLDLGGGDGTFLTAAAAAAPDLNLMLFDLPAVATRASKRFADAGLGDRAKTIGGDFLNDPVPRGADIISLVRVIHDHDDAAAMAILHATRKALPPGGTVLLAEPMAGTAGAETVGAYFSFYLLAMGSGRPRSIEELTGMLQAAGFAGIEAPKTRRPMLVRVLVGRCAP